MSYTWLQALRVEPAQDFDCTKVVYKMLYTREEAANLRRAMEELSCTLQVAILSFQVKHKNNTCPYCAPKYEEVEDQHQDELEESYEQECGVEELEGNSEEIKESDEELPCGQEENQGVEDDDDAREDDSKDDQIVLSHQDVSDDEEAQDDVSKDEQVVLNQGYIFQVEKALRSWEPRKLRKSAYVTAGDMGKYLQHHSFVYSWIFQMIKHLDGFYVPGDGPGMMSYILKKNNKTYYSTEPNPIGDYMRLRGVITSDALYNRNYDGIGLFLNVDQFFLPDVDKPFLMYTDTPRLYYFEKYVVPGTQHRMYTNLPGIRAPPALDWRPRVKRIMQRVESVSGATDVIHRVLAQDFSVPVRQGGVILGPGHFNVMTRQDFFVPESDYIYGTRASIVIVQGKVYQFEAPRLIVTTQVLFRIIRCLFRESLLYKVKMKWGVLVVAASREHHEFIGIYMGIVSRYKVMRVLLRKQEVVYHQVELRHVITQVGVRSENAIKW